MRKFLLAFVAWLWVGTAGAGVSCSVPFTFVPGALADANQVNANYAAIIACLLNAAGAGANNDITALNALTLEVYYRYLPLYQLDGKKAAAKK